MVSQFVDICVDFIFTKIIKVDEVDEFKKTPNELENLFKNKDRRIVNKNILDESSQMKEEQESKNRLKIKRAFYSTFKKAAEKREIINKINTINKIEDDMKNIETPILIEDLSKPQIIKTGNKKNFINANTNLFTNLDNKESKTKQEEFYNNRSSAFNELSAQRRLNRINNIDINNSMTIISDKEKIPLVRKESSVNNTVKAVFKKKSTIVSETKSLNKQ